MDDALLVGVLHAVAHLLKDRQAIADPEPVFVAVSSQRDAVDVLHDEVRPAVIGHARFVDLRDVPVVHQAESLALGIEPGDYGLGVETRPHELDRHLACNWLVLFGQIHDPHSALAKGPLDRVVIDLRHSRSAELSAGLDRRYERQSPAHGLGMFRVLSTDSGDDRGAIRLRGLEALEDQALDEVDARGPRALRLVAAVSHEDQLRRWVYVAATEEVRIAEIARQTHWSMPTVALWTIRRTAHSPVPSCRAR